MKAPDEAPVRADVSAVEHLELWLRYQRFWCEHKPSVTISVRPEEWDGVRLWVWLHLDEVSGVSFLPYEDHVYEQAPYEECTKEVYEELVKSMPRLQWSDLVFYETEDGTKGSQELACSANGGCEVVDLVAA
jgi:ribonucleoside-diphosphate reductase alpha chain